jgi:hypothetical protein
MAHACNPSYLEGRDQENRGSKPAQANSCKTLSQKTHHKNRIGGVAQGEGPTFKPQYHKKKVVGENRVTEGEASTPGTRKISLTSLLWGFK